MEFIIEGIFIILGIALVVTIIKYPRDTGNVIVGFLLLPFRRLWDILSLLLLPFGLLIIFIEEKLGINYLTKLINRESKSAKKKTKSRKPINFRKFKKYIIVNSTSEQIESELKEANESCPEVNLDQNTIHRTASYSVLELPRIGFYGYNFLIQWLDEQMKGQEIVGYASNGRTKFLTISDKDGENELIGRTNTGQNFWISMYDDLDNKQFLRLNREVKINSNLTTRSLEKMVKNAI